MRRKSKRKGRSRTWKVLAIFIVIGIGSAILFLYRQEIFNSAVPWLEKGRILGEKREVVLYFSDRDSEYLVGEKRAILKRGDIEEEAEQMIAELIKGPKGDLVSTLPSETKLLGLGLDERGVAKVNFDKAFSRRHPGGSSGEMMTVYSLVNSLALNFPEIKRVQFLVEGKGIDTISGHLSLKEPVSSRPDLIKKIEKVP